ncbi:NADPH-dependent FMN reductase [Cohaesibacter haloalkalitolerans]|uniref:NADPH-dependent FMN reductase n=1 Tax=Cohaesibacter haloalkalitolerans TaxID=1162980 RepID=UPI000E65D1A8|nr:NAD(P)H-dependent oxidoreductase [Cohaesibacter haloalkalitolerans]
MQQIRLLCFAGSIRSGSLNQRLAGAMAKELSLLEMDVTFLSLTDYPLPLFNADDEKDKGLPENAVKLARMIAAHDGIFIASPEHNGSVTPLLKNTLDWISRVPVQARGPFSGPVYAIGAASPGKLGGMRSLAHLRDILTALGALTIPEQISVSAAHEAFDAKGSLKDDRDAAFLSACARNLVHLGQRKKPLEWT